MHLELNLDLIEINLNWIEFQLLKKNGMKIDEKDIKNLFVNMVLENFL
jgi:hypothetical protein